MILSGVKLARSMESAILVDGVAPFVRFADAVAVVHDTRINERSYVHETVAYNQLCAPTEPYLAHDALFEL